MVGAFVGDGISIHALRKESDSPWSLPRAATEPFQSTLSVRRATRPPTMSDTNCIFQSTLSVRRATTALPTYPRTLSIFQSTLSVRRATCGVWVAQYASIFQSTLSVRRATIYHNRVAYPGIISIHALRKESDGLRKQCNRQPIYFNPRSP